MQKKSTKLGPWTVRDRIATTAYSEVFIAKRDRTVVALKAPRNALGREALLRESSLYAGLDHPGLPKLVDAETRGDWLALEYVPGLRLVDWSSEQPLEQVLRVMADLLDAVAYLHEQGVIHGDITPSNVLVTEGERPILLDLGLAGTSDTRPPEQLRGSLGFLAPEILQGEAISRASDLYAFGAVAYAAMCGQPPFNPQDPAALVYLPTVTVPLPPSSHRHAIPQSIDELILDLLARNPASRLSDADAIRERLTHHHDPHHRDSVVGMERVRDQLRRLTLEVMDGEDRAVVLYGPPGSGKGTLIQEVLGVARREGAEVLHTGDVGDIEAASAPTVLVAPDPDTAQALFAAAKESEAPMLILVSSERPVPDLRDAGAIELTPPPIGSGDAIRLAHTWGVREEAAERWWRESFGHPRAFHGHIRAWLRDHGRQIGLDHLNATEKRILDVLADGEVHPLPDIARELVMGEHRLLDYCEALLAEKLIESANDGGALRRVG